MKLKNFLIVVNDINKSKKFYEELFGLKVLMNNDGNLVMTDGLVLQERKYWSEFIKKNFSFENNASEIYFEEENIEGFIVKLETLYPQIKYVNKLHNHLCLYIEKLIL